MADLGAIATPWPDHYGVVQDALAFYLGPNPAAPPRSVAGTISGTVEVEGVATADLQVFLFYRKTMVLIDRTVTGSAGTFNFARVNPDTPYVVVARAPSGTYNDQLFKLT